MGVRNGPLYPLDNKLAKEIWKDSAKLGFDSFKLLVGLEKPEDSKIAQQLVDKYKNVKVVKSK